MTEKKSGNMIEKLKQAITDGKLAALKEELKDKPADLADGFDETLLMHAALSGKLEIVKFLVEEKNYDVNAKSLNESNALIRAALSKNLDVVKYLVEKGSELNAVETLRTRNACGYSVLFGWESHEGTALHAAIAMRSLPVTKYLVGEGADPLIKSPRGHTAFEQAVRYGSIPIIRFLAESLHLSIKEQVMTAACLNLDVLKYFILEKKAPFDFQDVDGMTPMMRAIRYGDYEFLGPGVHPGNINYRYNLVEFLLKQGADPRHKNSRGQTPLMMAACMTDSLLIDLLVEHGADPDERDNEGKQAVDYIEIPGAPSESAENAYEVWCWESSSIENVVEHLRSLMKGKQ